MFDSSRRQFMQYASLSAVAALLPAPIRAVALNSSSPDEGIVVHASRLDSGWQYLQGPLQGIDKVWQEDSPWKTISLPHCVNAYDACDPDHPYFQGQGWYRTRIAVDNPFNGGRTLLHFQGAGQTTELWVGSALLGTHKGGYDEFAYDITEAVRQLSPAALKGGVPITVCCDSAPDRDRVPSDLSDFCLYGGLYRHVNLVYIPAVALDAVHVLPTIAPDGSAQVSVKARLYNPNAQNQGCKISVEVLDAQRNPVHRATREIPAWNEFTQLTEFRVAMPELWSPETPHLYSCRVTLTTPAGQTRLDERFGIRHYEFVEHGPFKLNGKRLLLRGTHRHADHAGVAAAMSDERVREEMRLIREMGANFIRLAHYQQDRLVLELCDELGLMVWEEAPWCRAGIGGEAFQQNAKGMLTHMIDQHYNHPSIILWGLGNEDDWPTEFPSIDQKAIRGFMTEMRDLAHQLDGSRLTSLRRCDFARDIPDVYSPSIWAGWYRGNYHEYEQTLLKERERVKRFIHIEWGAESHAGRHAEDPDAVLRKVATGQGTDERGLDYLKEGGEVRVSRDGDYSETYACNLFDWHLKTQEKLDWLTGSAQWVFKDFASPLRSDNAVPRVNQKGVVERDLRRKESYYVFQSYWAEKPMAHIYGQSWPVRWGKDGESREVLVYSNCERAEMFLNGVSLGLRKRDSQNFPAAGLRWNAVFAKGRNHLRTVATQGGVTIVDEMNLNFQTEPWASPAELRLSITERKDKMVTVEAKLFDAVGVLCLDSSKSIRFSLKGTGRLIDNQGTARGSRVVQLGNGRAQISLFQEGGCRIEAALEGLPTAIMNL